MIFTANFHYIKEDVKNSRSSKYICEKKSENSRKFFLISSYSNDTLSFGVFLMFAKQKYITNNNYPRLWINHAMVI